MSFSSSVESLASFSKIEEDPVTLITIEYPDGSEQRCFFTSTTRLQALFKYVRTLILKHVYYRGVTVIDVWQFRAGDRVLQFPEYSSSLKDLGLLNQRLIIEIKKG